jgi:hypothetical protein
MTKTLATLLFLLPPAARANAAVPDCQAKMKSLVIATYNRASITSKIDDRIVLKPVAGNDKDTDGKPLRAFAGDWFIAADSDGDFIPGSKAKLLVRDDNCEIVSIEVRLRGND